MLRLCKVCGAEKPYDVLGSGMKGRGFNGMVCYSCWLIEQREWRATPWGREQANEAARASRGRSNKRTRIAFLAKSIRIYAEIKTD